MLALNEAGASSSLPAPGSAVAAVWPMGMALALGAENVGERAYTYTPVDDHTGSMKQLFDRPPPREHVPAFNPQASGTPRQWNDWEERRWRVRDNHRYFERLGGVMVNLQKFQMFLSQHRDATGRLLDSLLVWPEERTPGVFRFPWLHYHTLSQ